jgi:plastocyanin
MIGRLLRTHFLIAMLCAGCASPGAIRGTLSTRTTADSAAPVPGADGTSVSASIVDAVVYVEELDLKQGSRLAGGGPSLRLEMRGQALRPRILVVPVGTSVEFPNGDSLFHNIFSVSPAKTFDLGRYGRGKSKRVTFDKPGLVNVYCKLHSNMAAYVLVVPNRAFARPDSSGRFALPALPKGRYAVNVWHPDFPMIRREVTVAGGEHSELVLSLGS